MSAVRAHGRAPYWMQPHDVNYSQKIKRPLTPANLLIGVCAKHSSATSAACPGGHASAHSSMSDAYSSAAKRSSTAKGVATSQLWSNICARITNATTMTGRRRKEKPRATAVGIGLGFSSSAVPDATRSIAGAAHITGCESFTTCRTGMTGRSA